MEDQKDFAVEPIARGFEAEPPQLAPDEYRELIARIEREETERLVHAARSSHGCVVISVSTSPTGRPVIAGDLDELSPHARRLVAGKLALMRRAARPRESHMLPRARRTCQNGNRRPGHRTTTSPRGSPDDDAGDPEPDEVVGRPRHIAEVLRDWLPSIEPIGAAQ